MLSEIIKNNEEINRMLIRIMRKRREEGKSFQISTEEGLAFDEDAKTILENEFKRCIRTYEAEFAPYKAPAEQKVFIEDEEKKFPDCHGGDNGISVTPNMQAGIRVVFDMLNNFSHLINKDNVEKIKDAMNENEHSDYKYVGSTSDQLDFFGYLNSINGTDLDWFMSVLPHEAMHAFGVASGNVVMKEGATEEFTREMCEKYHIMFSPISHTQEAEFVRKLEMVVGRDKIKEASFYNQELYKFRDEGLSEIIKECPDMDIEELQDIFKYTRYKDRSKEEEKTVKDFEEKHPEVFKKIKSLVKAYNEKNYNERYEEVAKEFDSKLNLSHGSFQKYINILKHFYSIAKSSKKNIEIYRDLYTNKFSDLNLPEYFNEVEALMNEWGNENGFEIRSFEDLMRPINDYIKDKTLEVDNEPKNYTELLEHQNKELAALRDICIKMSIPLGDEEQSILQSSEELKISENDRYEDNNILDLFNQGKLLTRAMEPASLHRDSQTGKIYYDFSGVGAEINEAKNKGKEATSTSLIIPGNKMHTYRANGFLADSKKTEILHISQTDSGSNGAKDEFWASGNSLSSLEELAQTMDIGKNNPMNEINVNMKENAYIGIFTGKDKHNVAHGIIMQKVAERVLQKKLPIYEYDDMQGKLTNLELSSEDKIAIIKECLGDYKFRSKDVYYEIDGQEFSFDILEELEKENKKSILESAEEAIDEGTRIGKVNEQAQTMKTKQQERINPDIEKDSNNLGLDD